MRLTERLLAQGLQDRNYPPATIPIGEWLPDLPQFSNPGCTQANGCIATVNGYDPLAGLDVKSDAMDARCQGAFAVKDTIGGSRIWAGNASKLYEVVSGTTMTDRSVGGGYNTSADSTWEFVEWRPAAANAAKVIATNYDDPVQVVTIGANSFANMITSTNTPKARHVGVVGNFVVLGYTNDTTDGVRPSRVWNSAIDDETDFDPDAATQCDFSDIRAGGSVQKIVGGEEYGLVIMERAIVRMSAIGTPAVFRIDQIDRSTGTRLPNSVASWGRRVFFRSDEGFMMNDGLQNHPIGHNKVDSEFNAEFDTTDLTRCYGAIDPVNKVYAVLFPGQGNTSQQPNRMWLYHWPTGKWSTADVTADVIFTSLSLGYTLEDLDDVSATLEGLPASLDDPRWLGGQLRFGAIDDDQKYAEFTGANVAATFDSTVPQLNPMGRSRVHKIRPIVELRSGVTAPTITATVASRLALTDSETFPTAASADSSGEHSLDSAGRYHRFRASLASGGSWKGFQGFQVEYVPSSGR